MADPICRWRNTSIKQVSEFTQVLPHYPMPKNAARALVEKQWHEWDGGNDFFRTPYQLAAQLGLYYEDDTMLYPRFNHVLTIDEARRYIEGWIRRYYVPNPYTGSIRYEGQPIILNSQLYQAALSGESDLNKFFLSRLNIDLGNKDILSNILNNFSDIKVENGMFSIKKEALIGDLTSQNDSGDKKAFFDTFNDIQVNKPNIKTENASRQIIYYGAPGTGKSHRIKKQLEGVSKENIFRTTFHPDSDYSTFVGAYKPTKAKKPLYGLNGGLTVRLNDGKDDLDEDIITYKFIPQAFLNAYMQAYRKPDENIYLIIEEINRGNCAQIFGDLFQLLDRDENGKSEYTIKADADLKAYLEEELGEGGEGIKDGELCLPSNLYIYATMNTSDQSLFPIDSAFKRRWDWEYEPIKYKNTDWLIDIDGLKYRWSDFQKEVNTRILNDTGSEDKMLGDYFVNPPTRVISYNLFRNKILFYLWNDVCKDGDADIFPTNEEFSFSKLYDEDGKLLIISMMDKLGLKHDDGDDEYEDSMFDSDDTNTASIKYSINGGESVQKTYLATELFKVYTSLYPDLSVSEIISNWRNLQGKKPKHLIEDEDGYFTYLEKSKGDRTKNEKRFEPREYKGEKVYLWKGWGDGPNDNISPFMELVNNSDWGIKIERI